MAEARRMGAAVIRAWAFHDAGAPGPGVFQYCANGRIERHEGPLGLERLDGLIADAEEHNLRLILPLVNYWPDFGGMPAYLRWLGIPSPAEEFYRAGAARDAYRGWVEAVLTRRNTRTGRLYLDEPAVMAWELANEPRGPADVVLEWAAAMSAFVKSLDPNHLLAVGDEGGISGLLDLPHIDFGTCHLYRARRPRAWIARRLAAGRRAGKPVLLEEYGSDAAERDAVYAAWLETVRRHGGAGALLWMLGSHAPDVAGFRDRYTVFGAGELPSVAAYAHAPWA
jgi:mannan endo-1,4-beta-mannosidase